MTSEQVGTLALLKLGNADADLVYALDADEVLLGRDPSSDIVLRSRMVSRRHARIVRQGREYRIEDLASTGGTWLNGNRLDQPARLRDGDRIRLGDCLIGFSAAPADHPTDWDANDATILGERDASGTAERDLIDVRAEEKLSAILDIGRALTGTLDLQEVLDRTLETLFRIFPQAQRGFVLMRVDDEPEPRPRAMLVRGDAPPEFSFSRTVFDHVVGHGKAVLCTDVHEDVRFAGSASIDEAQVRTMICVALRDHRNRPVGLLQLDTSGAGERFQREDLDLLAAVAGPVGVAIDNARLLREAGRRQRRLEFLAEVGAVLSSSLQYETMLNGLARLMVPYLADLCLIDLIAEDGSVRRITSRHAEPSRQPLADRLLQGEARGKGDRSWWARVVSEARPGTNEIDESTLHALFPDPEQRAVADRLKVRSHLGIPLAVHGRMLGVLSLIGLGAPRRYDPSDRALAEEVAVRGALAIDHARIFEVARIAREEAESANQAKDRFLAVLSHELRTPLTPVLVTVTSLLDGEIDPRLRSLLLMVRRNIELEARLIDDLLDLTRISRGELRIERRPIDAHEVIRQSIEICKEAIEAAQLHLTVDLDAENHQIEGDSDRVQQVIWNLLQNAVRFTPSGGRITIRSFNAPVLNAQDGASSLIIEIRDSGIGIEPDRLERIFEPFQQGNNPPQRRAPGLGLGLAISRSLAEVHGGTLKVASDGPGQGSTFTVVLPTLGNSAALEPMLTPIPTAQPAAPLQILLVEDNRDTLSSLARALRAKGHRVLTASDCLAARRAIEEYQPDLLLSDIELPDGSGLELMRELVRSTRIPGIAMSGYGSEEDIRRSVSAGFTEHLIKPITVSGVELAIRRSILARDSASGPDHPPKGSSSSAP
ncbi:ATP-binding protein [Tautonia marina]|uniref:ATP-binding protein n=1 Tax=Tautonia marina TaxID=2653855 RepID=UPI001260F154|nr:ATP-binding protein [Tautonia marina]